MLIKMLFKYAQIRLGKNLWHDAIYTSMKPKQGYHLNINKPIKIQIDRKS